MAIADIQRMSVVFWSAPSADVRAKLQRWFLELGFASPFQRNLTIAYHLKMPWLSCHLQKSSKNEAIVAPITVV